MREDIIDWMLGDRLPSDQVLIRGSSDTCDAFFYESDHFLSYLPHDANSYRVEFVGNADELNAVIHLGSTRLIPTDQESSDNEEMSVYDAALSGDSYDMKGYRLYCGDVTSIGEFSVYVRGDSVACFLGDQTTRVVTSHFFESLEQWGDWFRDQTHRLAYPEMFREN